MGNREIFLKKLETYKNCVLAIGKESHGVILPEARNDLTELQKNITDLHERIDKNLFEIAIVGLERAGKSTFANALIGFDILPTKEERCTYTSSCVKYSDSTYAQVEFFTQEEFNERFRSNLKSLGVNDNYPYENFSEMQLKQLIGDKVLAPDERNVEEDVMDMIRSSFEISQWLGQPTKRFTAEEMTSDNFKNLIQNPDRIGDAYSPKPSFAVKKITVFSHNLGDMSNCVIYDVPGFDSPTAIHIEQTKERMNLADVIILIANASKPSLTGPQLQIFRSEVDSDGVPFNEKIFVFANRADESKELDKNMNTLRLDLSKYNILKSVNGDRLIPGSAFAHLAEQGAFSGDHAQQSLDNLSRIGITTGIDEVKNKLQRYNDCVRTRVIEKRVQNLETRLRDIAEDIMTSIGSISAGIGSDSELLTAFEAIKEDFKNNLFSYRGGVNSLLYEKPLTNRMLEALEEGLKPESLFPTDEEIELLKIKSITGKREFEVEMRKQKRYEIKSEFEKITLRISGELERGVQNELTEHLIKSLGIAPEHRHYEEIRESSQEYIDSYFSEFNFDLIHKALLLRFSDELFVILIIKLYLDPDRFEYFKEKSENIVSLALYTKEARERLKLGKTISPGDLPLINKILFHEETENKVSDEDKAVCINETEAIIRSKINFQQAPVIDYAEFIVAWAIENNVTLDSFVTTLKTTMPDIKVHGYDEEKEQEAIKHYLNQVTVKLQPTATQATQNAEKKKHTPLSERYNSMIRHRENTYEWIRASFNDDIRILTEILSDAVVNAIQLEVPFVANVIDVIDKIERNISKKPFIDFFDKNYKKIAYERFGEIEDLNRKNSEKQAIIDKLNQVLQEIN